MMVQQSDKNLLKKSGRDIIPWGLQTTNNILQCTKGRVTGSNESKTAEQGTDTEGSMAGGEISALAEKVFTQAKLKKHLDSCFKIKASFVDLH
jgi:hypothetical protein